MIQFIKKVKGELTHTVWPTRKQTINFTLIVTVLAILVAYFLGVFDIIFTRLLEVIL
jgi:preprotein translocase SecE subunit